MSVPVYLDLNEGTPVGTFSTKECAEDALRLNMCLSPEIKVFYMDIPTRCEICNVWLLYDIILNTDLVHCSQCHRRWDGNAQCQC